MDSHGYMKLGKNTHALHSIFRHMGTHKASRNNNRSHPNEKYYMEKQPPRAEHIILVFNHEWVQTGSD